MKISPDDYYKLHGLCVLAQEHNKALDQITKSVANIVKETDDGYGYYGCVSDSIFSDNPMRDLIKSYKIEVKFDVRKSKK